MKILIIGSKSFVGSNFIKLNSDIETFEFDLLNKDVREIDFTDVDAVLHLAAIVHQKKSIPENYYFKINCELALEVAKKAKIDGVKQFILMSTAKVYGESTTGIDAWDENSPCNPIDAYGKSKLKAEILIRELEDDSFKVAIIRSPLVYGPGVKANMYNLIKLVNYCPILPFAKIENKRSIVYIGNLIALLRHIINIKVSGVFIAGDKESISTSKLTKLIADKSEKKLYLFKTPQLLLLFLSRIRPNLINRLFGSLELNNSKTNSFLEFAPPYSTEYGLLDMINWYNSKGN